MYVTTHGLDSMVLQNVVKHAMTSYPDNIERIERALDIVFDNDVQHLHSDMWLVRGQQSTNYIVDDSGCPCDDATYRPQFTCKHVWATLLVQWTTRRQRALAAKKGKVTA